jgi:hypothetical protein
VLLRDGFDGENGERPALMFNRFAHWTVVGGTVDLVGYGSDWDFQPGHGLYVDLDGDRPDGYTFRPGKLVSRRAFDLRPGRYRLSFRLAGSQRGDANRVAVQLGTVYHEVFALPSDAPFFEYHREFPVRRAQQARLTLDNEGADGFGALLDDVALVRLR